MVKSMLCWLCPSSRSIEANVGGFVKRCKFYATKMANYKYVSESEKARIPIAHIHKYTSNSNTKLVLSRF